MTAIERIELINNMATICLVLICFSASTSSILEYYKKIAKVLGMVIIIGMIIDTVGLFIVGKGYPGAYWTILVVNSVNLILSMVAASLCTYYKYKLELYSISKSRGKDILILSVPVIIGTIFVIYNLFSGMIFTVDSEGRYIPNDGMFIINGIIFVYLFIAVVIPLLRKNITQSLHIVPIHILLIPVAVSVLVRSFLFPQVPVGFLGGAVSLLIFVISMSNAGALYDSFTKIYNKEYLSHYLNKAKKYQSGRVAGIMITVNNLKTINDRFGHKAGDEILLKTVKLIENMEIESSALVRYGGDEFILLISISDIETVKNIMLNIKERMFKYEAEDDAPYKLSLSMGTTIYIPGENISSFIRRMNEQMYLEKKAYHEAFAQ